MRRSALSPWRGCYCLSALSCCMTCSFVCCDVFLGLFINNLNCQFFFARPKEKCCQGLFLIALPVTSCPSIEPAY